MPTFLYPVSDTLIIWESMYYRHPVITPLVRAGRLASGDRSHGLASSIAFFKLHESLRAKCDVQTIDTHPRCGTDDDACKLSITMQRCIYHRL